MKAEEIKTIKDAQRFVEGCLNDFESGVSTKEETMLLLLGDYTVVIIELYNKEIMEKGK